MRASIWICGAGIAPWAAITATLSLAPMRRPMAARARARPAGGGCPAAARSTDRGRRPDRSLPLCGGGVLGRVVFSLPPCLDVLEAELEPGREITGIPVPPSAEQHQIRRDVRARFTI